MINSLSLDEQASSDCLQNYRLLAEDIQSHSGQLKLFHLHHFDAEGYLPKGWRNVLVELTRQGFKCLLTTCSGFNCDALEFLSRQNIPAVRRINRGQCIAAYRDISLLVQEICSQGQRISNLVMMNDSILPTGTASDSLRSILGVVELASGEQPTLTGFTDSYQIEYHLQSYGICANEALLLDPAWTLFWSFLDTDVSKRELILNGEIGLSSCLSSAGVCIKPLYPMIGRLLANPASTLELSRHKECTFSRINPSCTLWETLLKEGFGFIKKELIYSFPADVGGPVAITKILERLSDPAKSEVIADITQTFISRPRAGSRFVIDKSAGINRDAQTTEPVIAGSEYLHALEDQQKPPSRLLELRKFLSKEAIGLEVGPFHSPICPKSEGYNCLSLDIKDKDALIEAHPNDPFVISRRDFVEEVDIVSTKRLLHAVSDYLRSNHDNMSKGSSHFDYVVSSHNFEHLPDPIQFLIDVSQILREGGVLSMAIPVGTRCFDIFRPLTTTGQLIDAHLSKRLNPSTGTIFDFKSCFAKIDQQTPYVGPTTTIPQVEAAAFEGEVNTHAMRQLISDASSQFCDVHCHVFNPYSFVLIYEDLRSCGMLPSLQLTEVRDEGTSEFFVHFRKILSSSDTEPAPLSSSRRSALIKDTLNYYITDLRKIVEEM